MNHEGQCIGKYIIGEQIGSGGFGEVYKAYHEELDFDKPHAAVKVIEIDRIRQIANSSIKPAFRSFEREIKALSQLQSPYIVQLIDYQKKKTDGKRCAYIFMEYYKDGSLNNWLESLQGLQTPPSSEDIAFIIKEVAVALQFAHDASIIHLDVKPANVLIINNDDDPYRPFVYLADFGVAKFMTSNSSSGQSRGTYEYMAPELWEGTQKVVFATDQYALAVMAYELLTGHLPFQGTIAQLARHHQDSQPILPSSIKADLSQSVDAVLLKALSKKPEDRYASVTEFADILLNAVRDLPSSDEDNVVDEDGLEETKADLGYESEPSFDAWESWPHQRPITIEDYESLLPLRQRPGQLRPPKLPRRPGPGPRQRHLRTQPPSRRPPQRPEQRYPLRRPYVRRPRNESSRPPIKIVPTRIPTSRHTGGAKWGTIIWTIVVILVIIVVWMLGPWSQGSSTTGGIFFGSINTTEYVATDTAANPNPYSPRKGSLVLDDSFFNGSSNSDIWETSTGNTDNACTFTDEAYQVTAAKGQLHGCHAMATDFSNFAYEVQMIILKGNAGGMIFRAGAATSYILLIHPNGSYEISFVGSGNTNPPLLKSGFASAFIKGLHQSNLIAIVANGSDIVLYINHQLITHITNGLSSHGEIGLVADSTDFDGPTVVEYTNAKVWTF